MSDGLRDSNPRTIDTSAHGIRVSRLASLTRERLLDIAFAANSAGLIDDDLRLSAARGGAPELTPEETYLVEKARALRAANGNMVTTNHGVLMTYDEHRRLLEIANPSWAGGAPAVPSEAAALRDEWEARWPKIMGDSKETEEFVEKLLAALAPAPSGPTPMSPKPEGFDAVEMRLMRWAVGEEDAPEIDDAARALFAKACPGKRYEDSVSKPSWRKDAILLDLQRLLSWLGWFVPVPLEKPLDAPFSAAARLAVPGEGTKT